MISANVVARFSCPGQVSKMAISNKSYAHNYLLNFLFFYSVIEKFVESGSVFHVLKYAFPSHPVYHPFDSAARGCRTIRRHSNPTLPPLTPLLTAILTENRNFGYVTSLIVTLYLSLCILLSIFVTHIVINVFGV